MHGDDAMLHLSPTDTRACPEAMVKRAELPRPSGFGPGNVPSLQKVKGEVPQRAPCNFEHGRLAPPRVKHVDKSEQESWGRATGPASLAGRDKEAFRCLCESDR